MLFNSIEFLLFLPVVFALYWFIFKELRFRNLLVVTASYLFYGWWDWRFLLLIALTSLCSYASGILLEKAKGNRVHQKWISGSNITLNLLILAIFKYFNFFAENFAEDDFYDIDHLSDVGAEKFAKIIAADIASK